jgi:hypothetical protein
MTKRAMINWDSEQDLASLLDALAAELLATPERDLAAWLQEAGEQGRDAVEPMRRLLAAMDAHCSAAHLSVLHGTGLRVSITRNQ